MILLLITSENLIQYSEEKIAYNQIYNKLKKLRDIRLVKQGKMESKVDISEFEAISFLYSCNIYYKGNAIENLVIIDADNMDNPIYTIDGNFDVIILTTVLEHVHNLLIVIKM